MLLDTEPSYVLALAAVFIALCPIFLALRIYVRVSNESLRFGTDDLLVLIALPCVIGCCVLLIIGVDTKALAYPSDGLKPPEALDLYAIRQKIQYAYFVLHPVAMGCIKMSVVFLYRRIFVVGKKTSALNIITLATIGVLVCWTIAFTLSYIFQCSGGPSMFWADHEIAITHCTYIYQWNLGYAISDLVTDVWVLGLPIIPIVRLHMTLRRKLAVLAVFALGTVALAASITRLAIFSYLLKVGFGLIKDPTFDLALVLTQIHYWATLEVGLAFIACILPILRPIVATRGVRSLVDSFPSLQSLRSGNSSQAGSGNRRTQAKTNNNTVLPRTASSSTAIADPESLEINVEHEFHVKK